LENSTTGPANSEDRGVFRTNTTFRSVEKEKGGLVHDGRRKERTRLGKFPFGGKKKKKRKKPALSTSKTCEKGEEGREEEAGPWLTFYAFIRRRWPGGWVWEEIKDRLPECWLHGTLRGGEGRMEGGEKSLEE